MLEIFTRPRCHLCDVAKEEVERLLAEAPVRVVMRNVEERPEWERDYGQEVPVGLLDGRRVFKYRVDADRFRRALRAALEHPGA